MSSQDVYMCSSRFPWHEIPAVPSFWINHVINWGIIASMWLGLVSHLLSKGFRRQLNGSHNSSKACNNLEDNPRSSQKTCDMSKSICESEICYPGLVEICYPVRPTFTSSKHYCAKLYSKRYWNPTQMGVVRTWPTFQCIYLGRNLSARRVLSSWCTFPPRFFASHVISSIRNRVDIVSRGYCTLYIASTIHRLQWLLSCLI